MEGTLSSTNLSAYSELIAIGLVILGLIGGRLASVGLGHVLEAVDRRVARVSTTDSSVFSPRVIKISRAIVFWIVFLLGIVFALSVQGIGAMSALLIAATGLIPKALVSFAIVAAGHLLGLLASKLLTELNQDIPEDSIGPRLLYGTVIGIAVVMGLQNMAVNISFMTRLLLILVAVGGGGLMLAFAFGARQQVENLLARREIARFTIGERIRVNGEEGAIVEIHTTGVDVATDQGIVTIPAARFADSNVLRISEGRSDG